MSVKESSYWSAEAVRERIIRTIALNFKRFDYLISPLGIKIDLESPNRRIKIPEIEEVYQELEGAGYVSSPGNVTGRRFTTEAGRDFFGKVTQGAV